MGETLRSGDAAFFGAAAFLAGTLAAAYFWSASFVMLIFASTGAIALLFAPIKRCLASLLAAIFIFSLGWFYYHMRGGAGGSAAYAPRAESALASRVESVFGSHISAAQSSLLGALLSGSSSGILPGLKANMALSGTSYIVGMYGYKIHLLAIMIFAIGKKFFSRKVSVLIALCSIAALVAAAQAPVSAVRAGIMAGLALFARETGYRFSPRNALAFTAVGIILVDPSAWGGSGFLLSFASLVGIYCLAPSLQSILNSAFGNAKKGFLLWREHLAAAVAVNLAIMPLVARASGEFIATSFISNFLIALPLGGILIIAAASIFVGSVISWTAFIASPVIAALLSFQIAVISVFARISIPIPGEWFGSSVMMAYYGLLVVFAFRHSLKKYADSLIHETYPGI